VSRLSMKASESEDKKCQVLDLLNARLEVEIDVAEVAGEMNREDCHQKLLEAMKEVVPGIRKQRPT
jgi:DNA-binding FadR family transcriptional regulator